MAWMAGPSSKDRTSVAKLVASLKHGRRITSEMVMLVVVKR